MKELDTIREKYEHPDKSIMYLLRKANSSGEVNALEAIEYIGRLEQALAALSAIDPDAIRREILQKVAAEIKDYHDEVTWDDYEEGYKDGTENALAVVDAAIVATDTAPAILGTEPARIMHDLDPKVADCVQKNFSELIGTEPAREES